MRPTSRFSTLKEPSHDNLSWFFGRWKLSLIGRNLQIIVCQGRQTPEVRINRKGTTIVKDGED